MASIRFDRTLERNVDEAAKREGVTRSEFIRRAVQDRASRVLRAEGERSPLWDRIPTVKSGRRYSLERIGDQMARDLSEKHGKDLWSQSELDPADGA